jgi:hypothetical protein
LALDPDEVVKAEQLVEARDQRNKNQCKGWQADSELMKRITAMTAWHWTLMKM